MAFSADFLDVLVQTVTHAAFSSRDQYGAPSYGTPTSYRARVIYKNKLVRRGDGEEVTSRGHVWFGPPTGDSAGTPPSVTPEDHIVLPDGTGPDILSVESYVDETGTTSHVKAFFQ